VCAAGRNRQEGNGAATAPNVAPSQAMRRVMNHAQPRPFSCQPATAQVPRCHQDYCDQCWRASRVMHAIRWCSTLSGALYKICSIELTNRAIFEAVNAKYRTAPCNIDGENCSERQRARCTVGWHCSGKNRRTIRVFYYLRDDTVRHRNDNGGQMVSPMSLSPNAVQPSGGSDSVPSSGGRRACRPRVWLL
jgi:hypothetical protein